MGCYFWPMGLLRVQRIVSCRAASLSHVNLTAVRIKLVFLDFSAMNLGRRNSEFFGCFYKYRSFLNATLNFTSLRILTMLAVYRPFFSSNRPKRSGLLYFAHDLWIVISSRNGRSCFSPTIWFNLSPIPDQRCIFYIVIIPWITSSLETEIFFINDDVRHDAILLWAMFATTPSYFGRCSPRRHLTLGYVRHDAILLWAMFATTPSYFGRRIKGTGGGGRGAYMFRYFGDNVMYKRAWSV